MPRGNLEGVSPRALVLAAVAEALNAHDYAAAWDIAGTNRVRPLVMSYLFLDHCSCARSRCASCMWRRGSLWELRVSPDQPLPATL